MPTSIPVAWVAGADREGLTAGGGYWNPSGVIQFGFIKDIQFMGELQKPKIDLIL